ncbi:Uma2 family endonuclease [Leptolyngbya sp. NK1-12]|uniref:Uma2 family endonuclease n=1 Tax=Leptolyngbya sp. NK1-12 TaxID=2547451 RepID=A0AA97AJX3_9CYAN|nr:Uma2 family endonuclease [Leptolyngbya sp. NK1-12]WNZ23087.1 Uma2 family endonuclease [Leptolyngbya sp. NK1-12]
MQATEKSFYTPAEYLALETTADYKSEYIDGLIIPMAGGTTNHNRIALNLSSALNFAFRDINYEVFISDVRLWIPEKRIYTYPDVMIVAGEPAYFENRTDTILNPQVIVEVLSQSTETYDRERKFAAYRTIPTFREYLLVDQTSILVEQFTKAGEKRWIMQEYDETDEQISLETVPFQIKLTDLYRKVQFEAIEPALEENPATKTG